MPGLDSLRLLTYSSVYNAQHESLTKAWAEGFTKETGIKVTMRKGGDTDFANQIVQEGARLRRPTSS
jgi:spermidine/putrescine-binding protein